MSGVAPPGNRSLECPAFACTASRSRSTATRPVRGPWPDAAWNGWWGSDPPFHTDVFVLTHHARAPEPIQGRTTFHFVTDGIEVALSRAKAAASGKDGLGGGGATVRKCLPARLVDEMHVAIAPVLLGSGELLYADLDLPTLGYACVEHVATPEATHVVFRRTAHGLA